MLWVEFYWNRFLLKRDIEWDLMKRMQFCDNRYIADNVWDTKSLARDNNQQQHQHDPADVAALETIFSILLSVSVEARDPW